MSSLLHSIRSRLRSAASNKFALIALLSTMQSSIQSLIWVFWATAFAQSHGTVDVLISFLSYICFGCVGFCTSGLLYARYNINAVSVFGKTLVVQCLSLLSLSILPGEYSFLILAFNGLATGAFWSARSPIDMEVSKVTNRDTYIASIYLGKQIFSVTTPLFMALGVLALTTAGITNTLIWINTLFSLPIFYCVYKLSSLDLTPHPPLFNVKRFIELIKILMTPQYRSITASFFAESMFWGARTAAFPIIAAVNVSGIQTLASIETICSFLSIVSSIYLLKHWHTDNKLFLCGIGVFGISLGWLSVGIYPTIVTLAVLSFSKAFFQPMIDTGFHILMLRGVDLIANDDSDILGIMCAREVVLLIGRSLIICAMIASVLYFGIAYAATLSVGVTIFTGIVAYLATYRAFKTTFVK